MKIILEIPKEFEGSYEEDKFKDVFADHIATILCEGQEESYVFNESKMLLKAFQNSHRRTRSPKTNGEQIRSMTDKELAEFLVMISKNTIGPAIGVSDPDTASVLSLEHSCTAWLGSQLN